MILRLFRNSAPEGVICELDPPALVRLDRDQPVIRVVAVTDHRSGAPLLDQIACFVIDQRGVVRPRQTVRPTVTKLSPPPTRQVPGRIIDEPLYLPLGPRHLAQSLDRVIGEATRPFLAVAQFDQVSFRVILVPAKEERVARLFERVLDKSSASIVTKTLFQGARRSPSNDLPGLVIFELHRTMRRLQTAQLAVGVVSELDSPARRREALDPAPERVIFVLNDQSVLGFPNDLAKSVIPELKFAIGSVGLRQSADTVKAVSDRRPVRPPSFNHSPLQIANEARDAARRVGARNQLACQIVVVLPPQAVEPDLMRHLIQRVIIKSIPFSALIANLD